MSSNSSSLRCEPRYATARNPDRPNLLDECRRIAQQLGFELMGWQELVLSVATELVEAEFGVELDGRSGLWLPARREIDVTVPRQEGKTTLLLVKKLHRAIVWAALMRRAQRLVYTAQTGRDATKKVLEDEVPLLERSPLWAAVKSVRKVNGSEGILFKGGSRLDILASSESAGHGRTVDEGYIDEAFDDVDDRREQSIVPAMSTRLDGQLWVVSTMGTDTSIYLNRKVDAGRVAVSDPDSEIAYFEWAADPADDIDDPETWASCMPALGTTINERAIRHARQTMSEGEFRRAYLNQRTSSDERVIAEHVWKQICGQDVQPDGKVMFAIDCDPERSMASVAAADRDGNIELVDHDRGTGWAVTRAQQLCRKWSTKVAVDPNGPAGSLIPALKAEQVPVVEIGGQELTKACGQFYDAVIERTIHVRAHDDLDAAVGAVKKRPAGDAWVWARKSSLIDVSPLIAATVALYAAKNRGTVELMAAWA